MRSIFRLFDQAFQSTPRISSEANLTYRLELLGYLVSIHAPHQQRGEPIVTVRLASLKLFQSTPRISSEAN